MYRQPMAECFLYRHHPASRSRYYRVEIAYDLFDDVAVICEWGVVGGLKHQQTKSFANLRDASQLADTLRETALRQGYRPSEDGRWLV